ncbi:hypothetical protein CLV30_10469 [Haloactinopolyspora alba]|uniref:Uncharacterized protein n=1 Tax=Haloactinopolyspora alba TaxID=648780 RepID=A0A2P8E6X0_9ACTN|nr:hypothetical protein [Haloactinopolyspora alba]PSL05203.1 hypothetical protein CLV30_10469 [Haloactinopolyspora alba]
MPVEFIGANPGATLFRAESRAGFVSLWEAEWSVRGPGVAVLAWVDGDEAVRLLTPDRELGSWLAETFTRHFPELDGLPEIAEPVDCDVLDWQIGHDSARARVLGSDGSSVIAAISKPMQSRPGLALRWRLGAASWTLTNLLTFCTDATLEVDGARVLARPEINGDGEQPHSSAFIATHETWTRLPDDTPADTLG